MINKTVLAAALLLVVASAAVSDAKVYIDLGAPAGKRLPIAIQEFQGVGASPTLSDSERAIGEKLLATIESDLAFTGLFDIIEKEAFIESPETSGLTLAETNFADWRAIGAELVIKGGLRMQKGKLVFEVRLFDTVKESRLLGKRYVRKSSNPRAVAHRFTDDLIERLTGAQGIFSTRILYVAKTGARAKEIFVCDYDGANTRQLTHDDSISLSPRWSPDGRNILYTSYRNGRPALYTGELATGEVTLISSMPGLNLGGRWSPDGSKIALTLSVDRSPELYVLELESLTYSRLTRNNAIDVSAAWSPDGSKLVYVSDAAGNPHIYMINSDGSGLKRLTYEGKYNSDPSWSPDGRRIAFTRLSDGRFNIWIMSTDGSVSRQLTFDGDNKSPTWAPDGRHIVFSSRRGSTRALYIIDLEGLKETRVTTGAGDESSPAWSPN